MTLNNYFSTFYSVPEQSFTMDDLVLFVDDKDTKRLCYATDSQSNPWGDGNGDVLKWYNLPFRNTIAPIVSGLLDIQVKNRKIGNRCCYPCKTENEIQKIQDFIDNHRDLVFLRDYLDLSIALSMREMNPDDEQRTEIGELWYNVKYQDSDDRSLEKSKLAEKLQATLEDLPYFKDADYICAIPSRKHFMTEIINLLQGFSFKDISGKVCWTNKQGEIKELTDGKQKLKLLNNSGFALSNEIDINGKNILLVDDLYSSGLTMQFIAMKLKEKGARRVFGISIVKALKNS